MSFDVILNFLIVAKSFNLRGCVKSPYTARLLQFLFQVRIVPPPLFTLQEKIKLTFDTLCRVKRVKHAFLLEINEGLASKSTVSVIMLE